jgi:hypothetical protein
MKEQRFAKIESAIGGIVDEDYREAFGKLGINSIDGVFSFSKGRNLAKKNLASYRSRLRFETDSPKGILFLKRYNRPPVWLQLKNWSAQRSRKSCGRIDFENSLELSKLGINTAKVIAFGEDLGLLFEKRSFCITEQIPDAEAIERKLPDSFLSRNYENRLLQKEFIKKLAEFVKRFHDTGYRHRDLYFSHIFRDTTGRFFLIDLSRAFRPLCLAHYFRIKDVAQLYYSAPAKFFSKADRLRFYCFYSGCQKLGKKDKRFIKRLICKVRQIARHDKKHNKSVPCESY